MASTSTVSLLLRLLLLVFLLIPSYSVDAHPLQSCMFDAIYQMGDSISDTGNLVRESPLGSSTAFARLPYGQTFFGNATGRCSDGLLMIDYLALAAGLPFVNPYMNRDANFGHGVNFAVAGSTALPTDVLAQNGIVSLVTNTSLHVQLHSMLSHFNSICSNQRALFMVGETGGNDYNYALFQGKSTEQLKSLVPNVVATIKHAVERVIEYGAARVVVPGNFPIGCLPIYLTGFHTNDSAAYDQFGCLKELNNFAMHHNDHLQKAINELVEKNPNAIIAYADYYNAFLSLLQNAPSLGFDELSTQKACCGKGGDYDFDLANMCGAPGVLVCPDPHRRISWDGVHLTSNAYKYMADWLNKDLLPKFQCIF
ncbi:GDSL esterase/lipase At5g03980-like [Malania oleifera]|uniref:GDSL esterase/lipase At5g03980-like n=1 Tax=Malania oleifera TaxID=397392 RepID=UPI0025ADDABC|nr:GDSL esterase/lipase At5g03980-like [Malania oleifera]